MDGQDGACNEADPLVWFEDEAQNCEFVDRKYEHMYPDPVGEIRTDFAVRSRGFWEQEAQVDSRSRRFKCHNIALRDISVRGTGA